MSDTRTRVRERRQDRHKARLAQEHREAERMAGVALSRSDGPTSLVHPFLGERRALRFLASVFALGILVWLFV